MEFLIGAGGWAYFQVPNKPPLRAYSEIFDFVEVNSTFYEYPGIQAVEGWRRSVPEDFTFSVKCHQDLTHRLGLRKDISGDLKEFLELMMPLQQGEKFGCMLIQLPPKSAYNPKNLQEFLNLLWLVPETETIELHKVDKFILGSRVKHIVVLALIPDG